MPCCLPSSRPGLHAHGMLLPAQLALMGIALLLAVTGCLLSARGAKRDALKEGEAARVRYRERRALSVRLFSVVGAVALVAAAAIILFTHWQPRTEEVLLRAKTRTELARAMGERGADGGRPPRAAGRAGGGRHLSRPCRPGRRQRLGRTPHPGLSARRPRRHPASGERHRFGVWPTRWTGSTTCAAPR